jgi:hypothetical protein
MTRHKLPARRPSITTRAPVTLDEGIQWVLLLTIGFRDDEHKVPAEVFCSSFKVGTSMNSIVSDACILLSRLYQHGDSPHDIADSLCEPPSLVGQIATIVASMTGG